MSRFRVFAPSKFDGKPASIRSKADREKLVGKRVGYDLRQSSLSHVGWVTGAGGRGSIEISGELMPLVEITQLVELNDQATLGKWRLDDGS